MKKTLLTILALILTVTLGSQITKAIGSLTPSGTAGDDTQYTLNDIYNKLTNFTATSSATSSLFVTPGLISASFHTLSEIYAIISAESSDLVPTNIRNGVTVFGVSGIYTGALQWSDSSPTLTWSNAVLHCATLTEGGAIAGDWRLPTISEFVAAISYDWMVEGDNASSFFPHNVYFWSSTQYDSSKSLTVAWVGGFVSQQQESISTTRLVRCVR